MGNNRSGYDPTNEPTKDDIMARKPTTKEEYDKWMQENQKVKDIEKQFIKEKQAELQKASLIDVWRGKASKVGELI